MKRVSKFLQVVLSKNLVKVFAGSATSSLVKIATTIILSKVIAEKLGPAGLGLIGQLTSFVTLALMFATGGYQNGIVTLAATHKLNGTLENFLKPSLKLTLIISAICGLSLLILAGTFSSLVFDADNFNYIFYCFGLTIILYSFNLFFSSFLNGISDFKNFNLLNIWNSILSLLIILLLTFLYGIKGALLAVVLSQTLTSLAMFGMWFKYKQYFAGFFKTTVSKELLLQLAPFIKMTVFSVILLPIGQIIVRNILLENHGRDEVGIWEAVNRISGMYLMLIFNVMVLYYLPKLAAVHSQKQAFGEFKKGALFFGVIITVIGLSIYLFRNLIISLFLSTEFLPVADLVFPQFIADLFKIIYFLMAYFVIAKSLTLYYILTEILFFCIYISASYLLISEYESKGAVYASIIVNFCAMLIHMFFVGRLYFQKRNSLTVFLFGNK